jgi:hypothetical protein
VREETFMLDYRLVGQPRRRQCDGESMTGTNDDASRLADEAMRDAMASR